MEITGKLFNHQTNELLTEEALSNDNEWRLLRRLHLPDVFNEESSKNLKRGLFVDVETTGLSHQDDEIIELAMLPFDYDSESCEIHQVYNQQAFSKLREPSRSIPESITQINGITNEMVEGHKIEAEEVEEIVKECVFIIAHNAGFDRPMLEKLFKCFEDKAWSCSVNGVDWKNEGFPSAKLEAIGNHYGWFFDQHRGLADCEAGVAVLAQKLPLSGQRVLESVRNHAMKNYSLIRAIDFPRDKTQLLKARRYRWRPFNLPNGGCWWISTESPEEELKWLEETSMNPRSQFYCTEIPPNKRYSDRIWE